MWQRALRRWIWRGNVLLAGVVVFASAGTLRSHELDSQAAQSVPPLSLGVAFCFEPAVSDAELVEHIAAVRRFHGQDRPESPAPASVATEPPLSAYRVVLYVHDPDGRHALTLRCKDPAHDRVYRVRVGEADRAVSLLAARFGPRRAFFDVVRGKEAFTFIVPRRLVGDGRGIVAIGPDRRSPHRRHVRTGRTELAPLAVRTLKFVPFRSESGETAGVRVTGVKPGSWLANLGVKPGDVILTWEGASVRNSDDLHRSAERDALPRALRVLRGVAKGAPKTIELRRS